MALESVKEIQKEKRLFKIGDPQTSIHFKRSLE